MSKPLNDTVHRVTQRVIENSREGRARYLELMERERGRTPARSAVACSNLAHAYAGAEEDQDAMKRFAGPNLAIVTSYNDMLSAHQPYGRYPERMKIWAREVGATQMIGSTRTRKLATTMTMAARLRDSPARSVRPVKSGQVQNTRMAAQSI